MLSVWFSKNFHTHTHTHLCRQLCICAHIAIHMHTCVHTPVHVDTHNSAYMHILTCTSVTHICVLMCTHMHTCAYTHTPLCLCVSIWILHIATVCLSFTHISSSPDPDMWSALLRHLKTFGKRKKKTKKQKPRYNTEKRLRENTPEVEQVNFWREGQIVWWLD